MGPSSDVVAMTMTHRVATHTAKMAVQRPGPLFHLPSTCNLKIHLTFSSALALLRESDSAAISPIGHSAAVLSFRPHPQTCDGAVKEKFLEWRETRLQSESVKDFKRVQVDLIDSLGEDRSSLAVPKRPTPANRHLGRHARPAWCVWCIRKILGPVCVCVTLERPDTSNINEYECDAPYWGLLLRVRGPGGGGGWKRWIFRAICGAEHGAKHADTPKISYTKGKPGGNIPNWRKWNLSLSSEGERGGNASQWGRNGEPISQLF